MAYLLLVAGLCLVVWSMTGTTKSRREAETGAAGRVGQGLEQIVEELDVLTSKVVADIEEKKERLESLLEKADRKIQELEAMLRQVPGRGQGEQLSPGEAGERRDSQELVRAAQREKYSRIYKLADEGMDVTEIARVMQMGRGEVQLILQLRK